MSKKIIIFKATFVISLIWFIAFGVIFLGIIYESHKALYQDMNCSQYDLYKNNKQYSEKVKNEEKSDWWQDSEELWCKLGKFLVNAFEEKSSYKVLDSFIEPIDNKFGLLPDLVFVALVENNREEKKVIRRELVLSNGEEIRKFLNMEYLKEPEIPYYYYMKGFKIYGDY